MRGRSFHEGRKNFPKGESYYHAILISPPVVHAHGLKLTLANCF